jgi:hypothetical protein
MRVLDGILLLILHNFLSFLHSTQFMKQRSEIRHILLPHAVQSCVIVPHIARYCTYVLSFRYKGKIKQSHCGPGQAQRVPGGRGSQISRQSVGCRPYASAAFTPQEIFLVLISVKRLSRPQGHSATDRIMSMKKIHWRHRESNPRPSGLYTDSNCVCGGLRRRHSGFDGWIGTNVRGNGHVLFKCTFQAFEYKNVSRGIYVTAWMLKQPQTGAVIHFNDKFSVQVSFWRIAFTAGLDEDCQFAKHTHTHTHTHRAMLIAMKKGVLFK